MIGRVVFVRGPCPCTATGARGALDGRLALGRALLAALRLALPLGPALLAALRLALLLLLLGLLGLE